MGNNSSLHLMQKRLDIFSDVSKEDFYNIDGIYNNALRLHFNGGYNQQDRIIFDKRRSLDRALQYSYQSSIIKKVSCDNNHIDNTLYPNIQELDVHKICKALINPDKLKMDYDNKIVSVHYEENFHAGDVFEWVGTNTYWLIYLQDLTEKAYFRGEIRKCSYEIAWEDETGYHHSYAAIRGPVETKINYIQKHKISVDIPNYSLNILLPRTEDNIKYFQRYSKFYLQNDEKTPKTCWRVEAADWISTPGILEINAVEYYANETEDDIEAGLVGKLIEKPEPIEENNEIIGETFIKPKKTYEYIYTGSKEGKWYINKDCPVILESDKDNPKKCIIKWNKTYSGEFELEYNDLKKTIVVESLF